MYSVFHYFNLHTLRHRLLGTIHIHVLGLYYYFTFIYNPTAKTSTVILIRGEKHKKEQTQNYFCPLCKRQVSTVIIILSKDRYVIFVRQTDI